MGSLTRKRSTLERTAPRLSRICRLPKTKLSILPALRANLNQPLMSSMIAWPVKRGLELTLKSKEGKLRETLGLLKNLLVILRGKRRSLRQPLAEKKRTFLLLPASWMMSNLWLLKSKSPSRKLKEELKNLRKNLKLRGRQELRLRG